MSGFPALRPPTDDDRNRGPTIVAVNTVLLSIATAIVLMRLYTRTMIVNLIGLDDFLITLGNVSCSAI